MGGRTFPAQENILHLLAWRCKEPTSHPPRPVHIPAPPLGPATVPLNLFFLLQNQDNDTCPDALMLWCEECPLMLGGLEPQGVGADVTMLQDASKLVLTRGSQLTIPGRSTQAGAHTEVYLKAPQLHKEARDTVHCPRVK